MPAMDFISNVKNKFGTLNLPQIKNSKSTLQMQFQAENGKEKKEDSDSIQPSIASKDDNSNKQRKRRFVGDEEKSKMEWKTRENIIVFHRSEEKESDFQMKNDSNQIKNELDQLMSSKSKKDISKISSPTNVGWIRHVVQKNDTIMGIALKYGVSSQQIMNVNRIFIANDRELFARKQLIIPITQGELVERTMHSRFGRTSSDSRSQFSSHYRTIPRTPSPFDLNKLTQTFLQISGCDDSDLANSILQSSGYNLARALGMYFDSNPSKTKTTSSSLDEKNIQNNVPTTTTTSTTSTTTQRRYSSPNFLTSKSKEQSNDSWNTKDDSDWQDL